MKLLDHANHNLRRTVRPEKREFAKALRRSPTPAEAVLWGRLRANRLGFRFRRQAIIRGWIADFWCPSVRLVVEVDGAVHDTPEAQARDRHRDETMRRLEIVVLRFKNEQVLNDADAVVARIVECARERQL